VAGKISGVDGAQTASVGAGIAVQRPKEAAGAESSAPEGSSDVQITGTARTLAALEQTLRDVPPINEARVAALRTAIEQGTYSVRPEHVAEQLMQVERALGALPDPAEPTE
jgi:negative regulator of flagellin synthesis FlgM